MSENKILKEESIFTIIKKYAEKHTALFTTICSGLVAFFAVFLKLCYFAYQYGKLIAFHIDMNTIDLIKDTTIFNVLFYIILAGIMLIINYLGYIFYRQNSLIKYFLGFFLLIFIILTILFSKIAEINVLTIITNFSYILLILFFSLIFLPILNIFVVIIAISPSVSDLFYRFKTKYDKLNNKYKTINIDKQKYIKKYTIQLNMLLIKKEKIENKNNKIKNKKQLSQKRKYLIRTIFTSYRDTKKFNLETIQKNKEQIDEYINKYKSEQKNTSNNKNPDLFIKIIIIAIFLVIIIVLLFIFGYTYSTNITKIGLIENTNYFTENENKLDCAIIYENEEYIIISPCYETGNDLIINTSYQYRTENSNIIKHNVTYNAIVVTQYGDLTNYYKTD